MKKLNSDEKQLFDWDNELRFDSENYTDAQVCELAKKACEFALQKFRITENIYEGFEYQFEVKIYNVALGIEAHLQKNSKNKKSDVIKKFIMDTIYEERYMAGRCGFIFLLQKMKMDNELRKIASERYDFWETDRLDFDLLHALYKRKIKGFKKQVEKLIEDNPNEKELIKFAKKYIEQECKYK